MFSQGYVIDRHRSIEIQEHLIAATSTVSRVLFFTIGSRAKDEFILDRLVLPALEYVNGDKM